ncbi:MAG TPA: TIM barrel protein, partial [Marmoricola sp.]|nr:TIM barrel protein [Marmoricola sp.]
DDRPELDDQGWATLLANLDRINDHAAQRGVVASLHPHIGTMIESGPETERVLAGSQIGLCIDTGHLAVAGADPVAITQANPERVVHVHLKDVNPELAAKVQAGEITFGRAVNAGVFCPLGEGSVDVAAMVRTLESCGYQGWYVLEQDVQLAEDDQDADPLADVRRCRDYLLAVAAE